jgi:quinohemoprotein amine dehydrogenase
MKLLLYILLALLAPLIAAPGAMAFNKDSLVYRKCTGCHAVTNGKIEKVEDVRTTPEEWTVVIDRMARLYGMDLKAAEIDVLLKELCATQILSPEELEKVSYLNLFNNPQTVEQQGADEGQLFVTCVRCHSAGKIKSYRMTPERWGQLREFHLYQVPTVLYQLREMHWMDESAAVLKKLAQALPYGNSWKAPAATPSGSYEILGYEPGRGNYRGQASVKGVGNDDYAISGSLFYDDGTSENISGHGTLYGGHAFRTRIMANGRTVFGAYSFTGGELKGEQHFPAPDFRTSSSVWYPLSGKARVVKASPAYLLAGETTTVTLQGVQLPEGEVTCSDPAVEVLSAKRVAPDTIEVKALYKGEGARKAAFRVRGAGEVAVALADQIDHISVTPELGRARVAGGKNFPAEGVQFEAHAFAAGLDLGPVPAQFTLTPQNKRPNDDDVAWLGRISSGGKYLPIGNYEPIGSREFHAEGTGLVNVEAVYTRGDRPYAAKAMLAVTLPDFVPRIK